VARLFKKHNGKQGVTVRSAPPELDIAASRTGDRFYLHVANMSYRNAVEAAFAVSGARVTGGRVFETAPGDPRAYVNQDAPSTFDPQERELAGGGVVKWRFPARSVSAVELAT
jgi:hypothetical protein